MQATTGANPEPELFAAQQDRLNNSKKAVTRLKGSAGLAVGALLAGSLLFTACGDNTSDDCIASTPPPDGGAAGSFAVPTPGVAQAQVTPGSAQFTSSTPAANANRTYCRSRRTGGYYWYTGPIGSGIGGSSSSSS